MTYLFFWLATLVISGFFIALNNSASHILGQNNAFIKKISLFIFALGLYSFVGVALWLLISAIKIVKEISSDNLFNGFLLGAGIWVLIGLGCYIIDTFDFAEDTSDYAAFAGAVSGIIFGAYTGSLIGDITVILIGGGTGGIVGFFTGGNSTDVFDNDKIHSDMFNFIDVEVAAAITGGLTSWFFLLVFFIMIQVILR